MQRPPSELHPGSVLTFELGLGEVMSYRERPHSVRAAQDAVQAPRELARDPIPEKGLKGLDLSHGFVLEEINTFRYGSVATGKP